jgi:hypothetical protein
MNTTEQFEERTALDLQSASQRVALTTWRRGNVHRVEVTAKDGQQIRWFGQQTDAPQSLSQVMAAWETQGETLIRPFALGSPFDPGAWPCIAALVKRCLARLGANVLEVLTPATDTEVVVTVGALNRAAAIGEWQGIVSPKAWRTAEVRKLCAYLRDACGLSELAGRIEGLPAEDETSHWPF